MWRRAARIIPVYLAYVGVNAVLITALHGPGRLGDVPWLLSFAYNWHMVFGFPPGSSGWSPYGHLWTLSVEEQFYLLFPLIAVFAPVRLRLALIVAGAVAGPLIRWLYGQWVFPLDAEPGWRAFAVYAASLCHVDAFLLGALLAHLERMPGRLRQWQRPMLVVAALAFVAYTTFYLGLHLTQGKQGVEVLRNLYSGILYGERRELWVYTVVNLGAVALLAHAVLAGRGTGWLQHRWLASVGQVSYGGYLFHALILWVIGQALLPDGDAPLPVWLRLVKFVLAWALTVWLAHLSFNRFEVPVRRWLLARWAPADGAHRSTPQSIVVNPRT
jgi:peptidoglycan/LPS O-acetylase OafA/YrhL